jgi:hypothetical protein
MLERGTTRLLLLSPVAFQLHLGTYLLSEDVSVATENLQVKMQNSLSLVIILRIMIYKVVQFGWGADLKNFKDTWIHCSSKVHKDI